MKLTKRFLLVVMALAAMAHSATAFTYLHGVSEFAPLPQVFSSTKSVSPSASPNVVIHPKIMMLHYSRDYYDKVDIDIILALAATQTARSIERRDSPVAELRSIRDYHEHILCDLDNGSNNNNNNGTDDDRLCIVRFSAPWCKTCKATNVAWERMAEKLTRTTTTTTAATGVTVRFYEVVVGADGSSSSALKDMLGVDRVPQGIIHHPSRGLFGRKVDLNRSNLALLKKRLESYVLDGTSTLSLDGFEGRG